MRLILVRVCNKVCVPFITFDITIGPVTLGITLRVYLDILEGCFDVPTAAAAMKDEVWIM